MCVDVDTRPGDVHRRVAPDGFWWVCLACGKVSRDLYGEHADRHPQWDVSCALNAALLREGSFELDAWRAWPV